MTHNKEKKLSVKKRSRILLKAPKRKYLVTKVDPLEKHLLSQRRI